MSDRENILSALREKPLKVYEIMRRANVMNEESCQSLLLKMRDEGSVKFDIHKGDGSSESDAGPNLLVLTNRNPKTLNNTAIRKSARRQRKNKSNVAARPARLPTHPDAPNIAVLPNHVTMPVGAAIVESQVEFVR
jgi:hypothetical protein